MNCVIMLSVVILSDLYSVIIDCVNMLRVVLLNAFMLRGIMYGIIMLSIVMPSVI
jgi:hypothetical protein